MKSAYNLALKLKDRKENGGQSSTAINGERRLWDIIWKANIPQKIRIFGWRATSDSLVVQVNRVLHHQATIPTCSICGVEDESTFHALVSCPKTRALRLALRKLWNLPGEEAFNYTGPDWLLILLDQLSCSQREHILFLFWRVWHLRNDLIFGKGKETVIGSAMFLESYWLAFSSCQPTNEVITNYKGKEVVAGFGASNTVERSREVWQPPPFGHIKINVDASFVESLSAASVGVVARSCMGDIIVSSWDFIGLCSGVDEAELRACLAGLYIGISLNMPIIFETDCAFVASLS